MKCHTRLSSSVSQSRRVCGFSLLEILIVLAALSSVAAMAFIHLSGTADSVRSVRLTHDVAALNQAVLTYVASGGTLAGVTDGNDVVAKLKTVAAPAQKSTIAGLRGSMIDLRLRGVPAAGSPAGTPRAVWDVAKSRFLIQTSGDGFSAFILDSAATPTVPVGESRNVLLAMSTSDHWIWSTSEPAVVAAAPRAAPVSAEVPVEMATAGPNMTVLQAPGFSLPGALYDYSAFNPDLKVSLTDPNSPNTAQLYYSVANGPWVAWTGTPLSIPRALTTELRAYSAPLNIDVFEPSNTSAAVYETIYFAGSSSGNFNNPKGDSGLASNLLGGLAGPLFTWGSPAVASGYTQPNSLNFTGKTIATMAPDQLFEVGTLTYYNGSTYSGTNASSVQLTIKLNLTTPGVSETLPFTFNLLSTPNTKADKMGDKRNKETELQMDNADADYVYIPSVSTKFNTVIKGQTFYLVLSFGSNSTNGFTTINEFHTHENKTMSGSIFGRFTTTPPG